MTSPVYELAERYVERFAALDPLAATGEGIAGHDHEMTDYSPDGAAERAEHDRATLRALDTVDVGNDADRIAAEVMRERLELGLVEYDAGERLRDLRVLGSPVQTVRMAFDLMARDTADDWQVVAERLALVPQGLSSVEAALAEGAAAGHRRGAAPGRRVHAAGRHVGRASTPRPAPFFLTLVDEYDASGLGDRAFRDRLERLATPRHRGVRVARAVPRRGVRAARRPSAIRSGASATRCTRTTSTASSSTSTRPTRGGGTSCTASSTRWAWSPNASIPGADVDAVIEHLETDPTRAIEGVDEFQRWNQELLDTHRRRAQRRALRHPRAGAARRGDDRAARWRGGDVLHGPGRGLQPPRTHLVPDARQDPLPALGRGVDLLPRGRPRPSPADRAGALPRRLAEPLPAHARGHLGPRRGVGALRGAAHGRARLPRRPGLRARDAARAGDARGARRRRHRHAPRAARSPPTSATTPARRGRPSSRSRS